MFVYAFNQASQHPLYFVDTGLQGLELFVGEEMQVFGQQNVVFKLACRPERDVEELAQLRVCSATAAFCNVCRNGEGSSPNLAGQAKDFVPRENARDVIYAYGKSMALLPDFQLGVVLHDCTDGEPFSAFTYN